MSDGHSAVREGEARVAVEVDHDSDGQVRWAFSLVADGLHSSHSSVDEANVVVYRQYPLRYHWQNTASGWSTSWRQYTRQTTTDMRTSTYTPTYIYTHHERT